MPREGESGGTTVSIYIAGNKRAKKNKTVGWKDGESRRHILECKSPSRVPHDVKKRDERKRRERGNEIGGPAAIERDEERRATGRTEKDGG